MEEALWRRAALSYFFRIIVSPRIIASLTGGAAWVDESEMMMLHDARAAQRMIVYAHVRRDLIEEGAPLSAIVQDINRHIIDRGGIILASRQILTVPIRTDWEIETHFNEYQSSPVEHPAHAWDERQQSYFAGLLGVGDPFQYAEARESYRDFCISASVPQSYLRPNERALGLVDARRDNWYYYCPCHTAEVVYTSAHRLVCMGCGQMHCVLARPLKGTFGVGFSSAEWDAAFDREGEIIVDIQIPMVEYQEIYAAPKIWETDAWDEASGEIEFLKRGDPDAVARYRASLPTEEDLMAAGCSPAPMLPPPAAQLAASNFGVEIEENAAAALNAGAAAYARSRTAAEALRQAILSTFQAIELLLKIRLDILDPSCGAERLDNRRVVEALAGHGVVLSTDAMTIITALRRLRNRLQHGGARYGYRDTRALLAGALTFIDTFAEKELGWWAGDIAEQPGWDAMLGLPAVQERALRQVERRIAVAVEDGAEVEDCPHCSRRTVVREWPNAGFCLYCRRIPVDGKQ